MIEVAASGVGIGAAFWLSGVVALAATRRIIFGQPKAAIIPDVPTHRISPVTMMVDGARLHGWLAMPVVVPATLRAIVYFNGRHENPSTLFAILSDVPEHAVFVFHRRGLGPSAGWPSEIAHVHDGLSAVDWLCAHLKIPASALTVVGRSLGSGVAVRVAAARELGGLVLISAFDRLEHVVKYRHQWVPAFILRDKFASVDHMAEVRCPCLSIVGDSDSVIPADFSRALFAQWAGSLEEFVVANGGHRGLLRNAAVCQAIASFARR